MARVAAAIDLSAERSELEGLSRRRRTAQGLAQRAEIVLLAAKGLENKAIAQRVGAVENTAGKWRRRFACQTARKVGSDSISLQIGGDLALFSKRNQRDGSRSSAFQACAFRFYRDAG